MDKQDNSDSCLSDGNLNAPVGENESGQKLLRFLERRLKLPASLLHRWIRTGQIRLNSSRCKPYDRVQYGDIVRLPPFAISMAADIEDLPEPETEKEQNDTGLEIVEIWNDIWALNKPAGLPVQSGTGHEDSISVRLASSHAKDFFKPSPAHRLDRDTSGLLLAGASFGALKTLQEDFREGRIHKEYLVWVQGEWREDSPKLLRHYLRKEKIDGKTRMRVLSGAAPYAREAWCLVKPLRKGKNRSLLQVRLLTGVTHQIRAQLADLGHPVVGDGKYGIIGGENGLRLHAFRIILPDGHEFLLAPPWTAGYAVDALPDALLTGCDKLSDIREQLKTGTMMSSGR